MKKELVTRKLKTDTTQFFREKQGKETLKYKLAFRESEIMDFIPFSAISRPVQDMCNVIKNQL